MRGTAGQAIWDLTLAEVVPYEEMSISLGAAAVGALAALVFAGLLARRCIRAPRLATVALLLATAALALALGAQAGGYYHGFGEATFRAVQIGAELVAPLALTWALAELTAKSMAARFASRLALGAVTVIGAVVLATDPLSSAAFSKTWPLASVHYQIIPNGVLKFVAVVTALAAVISLIVTGVRARQSAGWQTLFLAVAAIAVATVLLDVLRLKLPANSAYAVICVGAAALAWFAARRASAVRLESLRTGGFAWDEDTGSFVRYRDDDTGDFGYADDTGGFRRVRGETDAGGWYADDTGGFRRDITDTDLRGWFRPGAEGGSTRREPADGRDAVDSSYGGYGITNAGPATGDVAHDMPPGQAPYGQVGTASALGPRGQNGAAGNGGGLVETGEVLPPLADYHPLPESASMEDISRLYGQIAIYTLLDETADNFERLASEVVEQVKTREPDTLVYVMHGVPAAPMQRILYAIYRDEAAFDRHERQPYIRQFEEEREPYVLATNVIELGVRHAKFTPLAAPRQPRARKVRPRGNGAR
jgi:quinol monooxygenase YgiN